MQQFVSSKRAFACACALALGSVGAGCGGGADAPGSDAGADASPDAAPPTFAGIDILFVVNDSLAMRPLQQRLGDRMADFFAALATAEGATPSLHVGVVSTTVEEPVVAAALCDGTRGGELRPAACLTDATGFASTTAANYAGELPSAVSCMLQVGDFGCPFEQPLEAMRRALDGARPENAGFLRDDALLVVVFLTDEDDCSAADPLLYAEFATQYGPFGSFRCFAFGASCDQPNSTLGPHTGCVAGDGGGAMYAVDEYAAFLDALKGGPGRVVIGGLVPPEQPVEVIQEPGRMILGGLCPDIGDEIGLQTWPTMRMHALARAFTADQAAPIGSMCDDEWGVPLTALAQQIADAYRE